MSKGTNELGTNSPARYFNRELSWIEFNARVLDEALQESTPLLERLKFISIAGSNFDEFFMVRVAGLKRQKRTNIRSTCPTGMSVSQILQALSRRTHQIVARQYDYLMGTIFPQLSQNGLELVREGDYTPEQLNYARYLFDRAIFAVLTPVRVEPNTRPPCPGSVRLHIAFSLRQDDEPHATVLGMVQVPPALNRFWRYAPSDSETVSYLLLEEIISANAHKLFPGYTVVEHAVFRITRDADLGVDEERDEGFLEAMEDALSKREIGRPIRMQIESGARRLRRQLAQLFELERADIYDCPGPLDLSAFMNFGTEHEFDRLRYRPWKVQPPQELLGEDDIWKTLKQQDILLHHPYETFDPVVQLATRAADDPDVLAIKMVLYRTSGNSPIVSALIRAAEAGKHVTVLVELKARFDEERNIEWAEQLERAGAIVIYGIANLKVHAKIMLIVRREPQGIQRYIHLGTGNYNDRTAKLYVDMGLLSSRDALTLEGSLVFNTLTGYSAITPMSHLIMAPHALKPRILEIIEREIARTREGLNGLLMAKMNALCDVEVIEALYRASRAGVKVLLNIRGICMLVPGVKGQSENITVVSIIDRYLEHTRILYVRNGGNEEVYLASADWMPRNLMRRVELMFPIEQRTHKRRIVNALNIYFRDNTHSHQLQPNGEYVRKCPEGKRRHVAAQEHFFREARDSVAAAQRGEEKRFRVRRTAVKS
jgi:polyphosphate kinase